MAMRAPAFFQSTAGLIRSRLHLRKPRTLRDLMQSDIVCSATAGARCALQKHSLLAGFPSSVLLCFGAVYAHTLQLNMLQRSVACAWSTSAQRFSSVDCKQQTRAVNAAMNGMALNAPVLVLHCKLQQGVDHAVAEQMGLKAEVAQLAALDVVVVLLLLDPRIRHAVHLHFKPCSTARLYFE